jgi:hypothetical protein
VCPAPPTISLFPAAVGVVSSAIESVARTRRWSDMPTSTCRCSRSQSALQPLRILGVQYDGAQSSDHGARVTDIDLNETLI